jgi:hypothetical protein
MTVQITCVCACHVYYELITLVTHDMSKFFYVCHPIVLIAITKELITIKHNQHILTHWHTQPSVRRSGTSMSFAFNSSFLSVHGMTCLIPLES